MATVKYGDVVPATEIVESLEDKLKRRRASSGELQPQGPSGPSEQTEPKNNEPKKRSE